MTGNAPPRRRFLGWDTVAGGGVLQILQAALYFQSFGVYVVVWSDEFGWSRTVIASGFALVTLLSGVIGPWHGALLDRYGPRPIVACGLVAFAVGLVLLSWVSSVAGYLTASLVAGLGLAASGFLSVNTAIVPWFLKRRSLALALMSLGVSVGGLLVPAVAIVVVDLGWRHALQLSAALVLVLTLPISVLMRREPSAYGQQPDGAPSVRLVGAGPPAPVAPARHQFTLAEALRTRAFWLLGIGHAATLLVITAVTVHLVPHLSDGLGYSLQAAASVVAFVTVASAAGYGLGGLLGDRLDKRAVAGGAMIASALALLVLARGTTPFAVASFALLYGLAAGVRAPLMGSLRADYFGTRHFGAIMGASMLVFMAGQLTGPIIAATMADALGDYRLGFTLLGVAAAAASLAFAFAGPPPAPGTSTAGSELRAPVAGATLPPR
jgi:MFS family permease